MQVAVNNEVLVSVSNKNYAWPGGMLQLWAENVKRTGAVGPGLPQSAHLNDQQS
jgi:hypothetical protein